MQDDRDRLRVFVSYARRDASAFVEELLAGLDAMGFEGVLDRHDIAPGEPWEARLEKLITEADTVVFVITPGSIDSDRCLWELNRALQQSKRVAPVVLIPVEDRPIPDALRSLNYVFFNEGTSYSRALGELGRALRLDLNWIREHTRLAGLAQRWSARERADELLLRGKELDTAQAWLSDWKAPAPQPTDLHRAFIAASDAVEGALIRRERRRQMKSILAMGVAVVASLAAAGGMSVLYFRAQESARVAEDARREATALRIESERALVQARITAARASLYEGLYWLKLANEGSRGNQQNLDWERSFRAFDVGLKTLGDEDAQFEQLSLRDVLDYGRRFTYLCVGFAALAEPSKPTQGVREYYERIRVPSCPRTSVKADVRPARPAMTPN